jgi:hypothetical protein
VRVYIAGPMTGLPDYNVPAFRAAADLLQAAGAVAVDPSRHGVVDGFRWADYMRRALVDLVACDEVAVLPGWERSRGVALELHVARALGMPARFLEGTACGPLPAFRERAAERAGRV